MKHILLIDDNMTLLRQVAGQLADDYMVSMAKSGAQALRIAARIRPDLILLDVEMPEMDGFETIFRIKAIPAVSQTPVIFLTASHDTETQVRALEAGAVDFIKKPFAKGVLLHRIELHLRLAQYQRDLEKTVRNLEDGIITSFADVIEWRDEFDGHHVQTTRSHVELLGQLLRENGVFGGEPDEETLDLVARASVLHDVGKVGVSDLIMLKPGKLTEEEYAEAKKHSVIGAKTLEAIHKRTPMPLLAHAAVIALRHHERYDGTGYPDGLKGDEIPLCARIVAVADVYDSLVSETVFRPAMSHEDACLIIGKDAGSKFDPRIVEVFLANNEAFAALAEERAAGVPEKLLPLGDDSKR